MTPKEKAKDLYNKLNPYCLIIDYYGDKVEIESTKKLALIAVDEIINVCPFIDGTVRETEEQLDAYSFQFVSYWEEVKQEISKL